MFWEKLRSFIKRKLSQRYRFDLQYKAKKWDGLREMAETGRYNAIVNYIRQYASNGHILDLGCGEGILLERLQPAEYSHYRGVDFSAIAIGNIKTGRGTKCDFIVADLNGFSTNGQFDAIVYNESLYYLKNPVKSVAALLSNLADNGVFIISMVDKHGKERTSIWRKLNSILQEVTRTKVTNLAGHSWTVKVYRPKKH